MKDFSAVKVRYLPENQMWTTPAENAELYIAKRREEDPTLRARTECTKCHGTGYIYD